MKRTCHYVRSNGTAQYYLACDENEYLCHPHHRMPSKASTKSQWAISRPEECHTYCQASLPTPSGDGSGGLWYISVGAERVLGTKGERLAYFEIPGDGEAVPRHGYPVGPNRRGTPHRPDPVLVESWQRSGRIARHVADKIRRGRI